MDLTKSETSDTEEDDGYKACATKLIESYYLNQNGNKKLWETIDILKKSNEEYVANLSSTQKQLQDLISSQKFNESLLVQYNELRDKYNKLESNCRLVTSERDDLKTKLTSLKSDIELKHIDEIKIINEAHDKKLMEMKSTFDKKETEFNNEMHRSQASSAYKYDERESELLNRIAESNYRLRESGNTNTALRSELLDLKAKYQLNLDAAEKNNEQRIQELENKLVTAENQVNLMKERFEKREIYVRRHTGSNKYQFDRRATNKFVRIEENYTSKQITTEKVVTKEYSPLPVAVTNTSETDNSLVKSIYKEKEKKTWPMKPTMRNVPMAKVKPTSETVVRRKRKLYDPDVDYLNPENTASLVS